MPKLLIVEDDRELLDGLASTFRFHGFTVLTESQGPSGLVLALDEALDLLILDVMLPGIDGFDICKRIRARNHRLPIILLTAKAQEAEKLLGFELGADDYVTKPFSIKELVARVQAVLKRTRPAAEPDKCRAVGAAKVDLNRYTIDKDGNTLTCTPREIMVLRLFLDNPGCVLSRERILDEVWGLATYVTTRTVDNFILRLRQKLEPDPQNPRHLLTIHGAGYKYEP
jgi:DNA-binding response OmpR family regulator